MAILTTKRARKILGKMANGITDTDLEHEIKAAELLKVIYFSKLKKAQPFTKNNAKT